MALDAWIYLHLRTHFPIILQVNQSTKVMSIQDNTNSNFSLASKNVCIDMAVNTLDSKKHLLDKKYK